MTTSPTPYEAELAQPGPLDTRQRWLLGLGALLVCALLGSMALGAFSIAPRQLLGLLVAPLTGATESTAYDILWVVRMPRTLMAALVGAGLAVSGASLQGIFRNPLADPGLIGVSSGAALGVVGTILLMAPLVAWLGVTELASVWLAPAAAFAGGLGTTWVVVRLATRQGRVDAATMLLAGVAINALAGALIGFATYVADDAQLRSVTLWSLGSLSGSDWTRLGIVAAASIPAMAWLMRYGVALDLMALGQREAGHLGVEVSRVRRRVVALCALIVGAGVGFTGLIGFVGLVVPHLLRLGYGPSHRMLLPGSALLGAALLVIADLAARTMAAPAELPIGVVTALVGAPFFLWLLLRQRGEVAS